MPRRMIDLSVAIENVGDRRLKKRRLHQQVLRSIPRELERDMRRSLGERFDVLRDIERPSVFVELYTPDARLTREYREKVHAVGCDRIAVRERREHVAERFDRLPILA